MDSSSPWDMLVVSGDPVAREALSHALKSHLNVRISLQGTARAAITSYTRARYDAIVCDLHLGDCDCWRFLRMIRSGRFGFPHTRAFVLVPPEEHELLTPLADEYTILLSSTSPLELVAEIDAHHRAVLRPTVLLVEDESKAAAATLRSLEKQFDVEWCDNGQAALDAWRKRRHALVILDLMLPGMSGAQVLESIMQERPEQPVVVLTAYDAPEQHQDLVLSGATEFLSKPVSLNDLSTVCARVLHEQACLISAKQARGVADRLDRLSTRIHAADYTLRRGRTAEATLHLQHAMSVFRTSDDFRFKQPSDDQWTALIHEFDPPMSR